MTGQLIAGIILVILAVFIIVILVRTIRFQPKTEVPAEETPVTVNQEKIVEDMVDMIRCRTVSNRDEAMVDRNEFTKFHKLLEERFPHIHNTCHLEKVGKTGLLYYLPGKSSEKPSVCMAHYDVVPVEEEGWTKPAFDGIIEDGCIWGRGTLDTKGTLCGVMEALEIILAE